MSQITSPVNSDITIGVLSLQGAFEEHMNILKSLGISTHQVKDKKALWKSDGLIIPGGESTAITLIAQRCGLWEDLVEFANKRPVYGTCAGMILLAKQVDHQKKQGQSTLMCMDIAVDRNFFGSQIASFGLHMEAKLHINESPKPFFAYFIRAPIVEKILSAEVHVISQLSKEVVESYRKFDGHILKENSCVIAVQQKHWLATAFHPELSNCTLWHSHFIEMVRNKRYN
eukprot:NODE_56_length_25944_cov_0.235287.p10 type:complete len:229 gc:universal NODE_56_length_25944_cov_0.235287:6394-5708(-)